MRLKILLLLIILVIPVGVHSQGRSGRVTEVEKEPGKEKQTELLVNSRDFVFRARRAIPSSGSSVDLTTNQNFVRFKPDFIESYMPFFGRAYSGVGYGDTGLHFKGKPEEFTIERRRKNFEISATVRGETDNFKLFLTVSPGGNATLSIISNNRQSISYRGEIRAPGKEKERE